MNTRRLTRRAATIDVVNNIPTKQRKTRRSTRNSFSNSTSEINSNPETEMPTMIDNENENVAANSQHSNGAENDDSTQPLFPDSDPNGILAEADLLLAQIDATYAAEALLRQNKSMEQRSSGTEEKPSTSTTTDNDETSVPQLNEQSPKRERTAENSNRSANDSLQSTSTINQSQYDDSVILIDDGAMPRPSRSDEDVIFVEEYVKEPPRITGVVDLCGEDDDESVKKSKLMQVPNSASTGLAALADQFPTSPVASTSNGGVVVKCPVCLDKVPQEEVHSTICGHLYCGPCIKNTVKTRKKCPMCNRTLSVKQVHRIYFHN